MNKTIKTWTIYFIFKDLKLSLTYPFQKPRREKIVFLKRSMGFPQQVQI